MSKKILAIGILLLFVGVVVYPSTGNIIGENIKRNDLVYNRNYLLYENFSGIFPPDGWSTDWWTQCNTSCCGNEPPCACLVQGDFNKSYITSKPVDASNYEKVNLSFFFDAGISYPQYTYIYIRIRVNETSPWKNITPWENPVPKDLFPIFVDMPIILGSGNNADALQVNWTYHSYYSIPFACLDEVIIYISHPNNPPDTPVIEGKKKFKEGENGIHPYTIYSTDPENDDLMYLLNWSDGTQEWIGPFPSGEKFTISVPIPLEKGTYVLFKVKAFDFYGGESKWAILKIIVPRNRATYNSLLLRFLERFPLLEILLNLL